MEMLEELFNEIKKEFLKRIPKKDCYKKNIIIKVSF
jgi:hypothetical protein